MNEGQRIALFLLVCIPVRLFLVYWAIMIHSIKDKEWSRYKQIFEFICLCIGISFIYQFFKGNMVGFSGGKVWWSTLRIIHAFNYLAYAFMSYNNIEYAYLPLLFDVLVGLIGFGFHHLSIDIWKWIVNRGVLIKPIIH